MQRNLNRKLVRQLYCRTCGAGKGQQCNRCPNGCLWMAGGEAQRSPSA